VSILVDRQTRLCVAGITGREGTFHTLRNRDYGTQVVSGVTPGKGGQDVDGISMGHAGAIVSGSRGTAAAKAEALEGKGVRVGRNPTQVAEIAVEILGAAV
jgi:succinyl-CoA synthetase alpha subunit